MKLKISKTVHPPKPLPLMKWMQEFKVGVRIEVKSMSNNADNMNQYYNLKKLIA